MNSLAFHQAVTTHVHRTLGFQQHGYISAESMPHRCNVEFRFTQRGRTTRRRYGTNVGLIRASALPTSSMFDHVSPPSNEAIDDTESISGESALILVRHGESLWNEKNLFTGCVDVPLTKKGVEEAIEAGKRISHVPVDAVFTSALIRSKMTAMLAMTQHCRMKVPIFMHNESEQARVWSQIYSEETIKHVIPVVEAWQLNERMYGELQGFDKQETAEKYGKEQVHKWRRSYDTQPPNGESLHMCAQRAVSYFQQNVEPQLLSGKNVMVVAHANSLRSIIMYLDELTSQEVINLELSTGVPMLYISKEGKFIRRGSLAGSSEAGVYAYTKTEARRDAGLMKCYITNMSKMPLLPLLYLLNPFRDRIQEL